MKITANLSILSNFTQINNMSVFAQVTSYFGIIIIGLGCVFNSLTLFIFRLNKELRKMSTIVILSFICVSDTLSLFTWNLDHFLVRYDIYVEDINLTSCKIFSFMQYSSLQVSALLLSLCSIDRYFKIASKPGNLISKLPFGTFRSSLIWSISIISFICLLNSILLISDRIVTKNKIDCYVLANGLKVNDSWDKLHMFIYSFIPFVIMTIFNVLLIKKMRLSIKINHVIVSNNNNNNNHSNKKNISLTLLIISFVFLVMTFPSTIAFSFLADIQDNNATARSIFHLLDHLSFLYHTTLFFNCYLTNLKFRNFVFDCIKMMNPKIFK